MKSKVLISVVGPTAIGKTSLGIEIAKYFKTEIISADSRQFFKEMRIGTAVPSKEELLAVPHHFIQHKSIAEPYSVGDFEREAIHKLDLLFKKHDIVVMVGGSGLYVKAVTEGLDEFPEVDPQIRKDLNKKLQEDGLTVLQEQLKTLDPDYFQKVDKANPQRIIRALEMCIGSGQPYSSFLQNKKSNRSFHNISIGLTAPREIIYARINERVNKMIAEGLLAEVENLQDHQQLNALNTVGYKELFLYLDGKITREEAIAEIQKNTRRFAKRQLTWFGKHPNITWFDLSTSSVNEIISYIKRSLRS